MPRTTTQPAELELFNSLDAMVIVKDLEGRILHWNRAAERAYGFPQSLALGQRDVELLRTKLPIALDALTSQLHRDGHWDGELVQLRRDGSEVFVTSRWLLQRSKDEEPRAVVQIDVDATQRRDVQRLKDEFVAIVSHELRTPLTSIRGALGLLEGNVVGELDGEAMKLVRIARSNADRLIRLVNEILDLEKMEAGKVELRRREVDGGSLVSHSVEAVSALAAEAGVEFVTEVPAELRLVVDPDKIAQLLTNFLSNAIKFSPRGSRVTIRFARRGPRTVRLSVRDEGEGIAPEQQQRIFEKFHQVDSSDVRKRGGTGLGLAICKAIAEHHGGHVGVESRPGAGATFFADLPANAVSSQRSVGYGPRRLVLLIDPSQVLSRQLEKLLADERFVVGRALDGEGAQRWLDNAHPAAIVVDVDAARGDLLDLLHQLASRFTPVDAPTIVLGAHAGHVVQPLPIEWVADPLDEGRMRRSLRVALRPGEPATVLLIEEDASLRELIAARLRHLGVSCVETSSVEQARAAAPALTDRRVVLLDLAGSSPEVFEVIRELRRAHPESTSVIVHATRDLGVHERVDLSRAFTSALDDQQTSHKVFLDGVRRLLALDLIGEPIGRADH